MGISSKPIGKSSKPRKKPKEGFSDLLAGAGLGLLLSGAYLTGMWMLREAEKSEYHYRISPEPALTHEYHPLRSNCHAFVLNSNAGKGYMRKMRIHLLSRDSVIRRQVGTDENHNFAISIVMDVDPSGKVAPLNALANRQGNQWKDIQPLLELDHPALQGIRLPSPGGMGCQFSFFLISTVR